MAFYFSATPVFTPQTYEEMVKPLDKYNEAYEKVESQLVDLQDKTQYWADRVQDSPVAKQMYEYYNNKLQQLSDDFAKGMTSGNRAKLIEMHKDYSKTMGALENQWKAKEAFIKERKEKGNDYIYGVYENPNYVEGGNEPAYLDEVNMDMFANGRTPTTRGLNLDKYTNDIATDVSLFSDSVDATLGKDIKTEDGQMILHNIKNGQLTQEDVLTISDIMKGLTDGSINEKVFKETEDERAKIYYTYAKILTDHINNDTYFPYMSEDNKNKIMEATERGLFAGLQKNDGKLYNNAEYISAKDKWNQWVQSQQLAISRATANNSIATANNKKSKVNAEGRTSIPIDLQSLDLTELFGQEDFLAKVSKMHETGVDGANISANTDTYNDISAIAKQLGTTIDNVEIVAENGKWVVRVKGTGNSNINNNVTDDNKKGEEINPNEGL